MSVKTLRDAKRAEYTRVLMELLGTNEDVGQSASGELNFPVVLEDGTEDWIVVKVSIPTGTRDGDAYDGYAMREEYTMKCAEKAEKAKAQAAAKAKKIARDQKLRESKAQAKKEG